MSERIPMDGEPETHAALMGALAIGLVREGVGPEEIGVQLIRLKGELDALADEIRSRRTLSEPRRGTCPR